MILLVLPIGLQEEEYREIGVKRKENGIDSYLNQKVSEGKSLKEIMNDGRHGFDPKRVRMSSENLVFF